MVWSKQTHGGRVDPRSDPRQSPGQDAARCRNQPPGFPLPPFPPPSFPLRALVLSCPGAWSRMVCVPSRRHVEPLLADPRVRPREIALGAPPRALSCVPVPGFGSVEDGCLVAEVWSQQGLAPEGLGQNPGRAAIPFLIGSLPLGAADAAPSCRVLVPAERARPLSEFPPSRLLPRAGFGFVENRTGSGSVVFCSGDGRCRWGPLRGAAAARPRLCQDPKSGMDGVPPICVPSRLPAWRFPVSGLSERVLGLG